MKTELAPALHIALRASPFLQAALLLLSVLATFSFHLSAAPRMAMPLPLLLGTATVWRMRRLFPCRLVFDGAGRIWRIGPDDEAAPIEDAVFSERGPLGVLRLRMNGREYRLPWAADVLGREARRSLRLWFMAHEATLRGLSNAHRGPG